MNNKVNRITNLICSILWLISAIIFFICDNIIVGIIDIFLCLLYLFLFANSLFYNKNEDNLYDLLEIEKFIYKKDENEYLVYLIENEVDDNITDFYIKKKESKNLNYVIGIEMDNLEEDIEEFIESHLDEWISIC